MRIDSEYHILENSVKYDDNIINIVVRVDKDASENEEYLFDLDNELAKRLLTYIFNRNSFMKIIIILHVNLGGMPVIVCKVYSIVKGLVSKQWRKVPLEMIMHIDFNVQSTKMALCNFLYYFLLCFVYYIIKHKRKYSYEYR